MKPPNWDRIQEIYYAAAALPRTEREVFVAKACAGDPNLLREVTSLLSAADRLGSFLEVPVVRLGLAPDNLIGTTIGGRYAVERELGHGGMSQVYFARDRNLGEPVVIKVLSPDLVEDSYARQKFEQEVEALLRIRHSGVVRVFDRGKLADGRPYIVMEYVDGETLRTQILTEGMDLKRAASILKQIGEALEHVHEKGIFHRDLKPENVILKRDTDSVVLIDFGIAKVKESVVAPSTVNVAAGTLRYMSPEQLRGQEITAASDVYSMALVAYEMVTGRPAFSPASTLQLLEMQRAGVRVKPKHLRENLSRDAQAIILRALRFKPKARYRNAKQFGDELAAALVVPPKPRIPIWAKVIGGLIVLALLAFGLDKSGIVDLRKFRPWPFPTPTPTRTPTRSFTYSLTIQQLRNGKNYQDPYQSNGVDVFESGDKFRLNVSSPEPGYVYVFNHGPAELNDTSFTMVYPRKDINNGSSTIGANQTVESEWIIFSGPTGDENAWIVWSTSPVNELESAKAEAFNHPKGGLSGETLVKVTEYLRARQSEIKVRTFRYQRTQTVLVRGPGEVLITLAEIKHQ